MSDVTDDVPYSCCSGCSFDAIGLGTAGPGASRSVSRGSSSGAGGETAACLLLLPSAAAAGPGRRGSFLYRSSDSDSELSPMSLSRKHSAANSDSSASVYPVTRGPIYKISYDLS